jgi:hypothetical protein
LDTGGSGGGGRREWENELEGKRGGGEGAVVI